MILFISDLHLDPSRPAVTQAFYHFLANAAPQADSLYILGDLFELWVGDDDDSPLVAEAQARLRTLSEGGTALFFMHGNRDFLIGEQFAAAAGASLLPDPATLEVGGEILLLMHGDTLCTGDQEYLAFRQQVRQRSWIEAVLARPLEERRALGRQLREQSQSMNSRKAEDIMDVSEAEVKAVMRRHGAERLIHGHTHRPARHSVDFGDAQGERIVLGDWDQNAWCLRYDGDWELLSWPIPPL